MDTTVSIHVTVHVKDAMQLMGCATPDVKWAGGEFIARKVYDVHSCIKSYAGKTDTF